MRLIISGLGAWWKLQEMKGLCAVVIMDFIRIRGEVFWVQMGIRIRQKWRPNAEGQPISQDHLMGWKTFRFSVPQFCEGQATRDVRDWCQELQRRSWAGKKQPPGRLSGLQLWLCRKGRFKFPSCDDDSLLAGGKDRYLS